MRFLKRRHSGSTNPTMLNLYATGECIPCFNGVVFIDALKDIEPVINAGIDGCISSLKIKYKMDEIDESKVDPNTLNKIKERFPKYFTVKEKRTHRWKLRVCGTCGKSFDPRGPGQRNCDSCIIKKAKKTKRVA